MGGLPINQQITSLPKTPSCGGRAESSAKGLSVCQSRMRSEATTSKPIFYRLRLNSGFLEGAQAWIERFPHSAIPSGEPSPRGRDESQ